jgi:hypothetical protein
MPFAERDFDDSGELVRRRSTACRAPAELLRGLLRAAPQRVGVGLLEAAQRDRASRQWDDRVEDAPQERRGDEYVVGDAADLDERGEQDQVGEKEVGRDPDRPQRPILAHDGQRIGAQPRGTSGAILDRIALELHEDPQERLLELGAEPARGPLAAQKEVAGDPQHGRDHE